MFRRTEKAEDAAASSDTTAKAGGKGRPTPTRKEAEAAARERARAGIDKKAAQKLLRERRTADNRKMREGLKAGDERFLPARDQGPVRRFVRDWVDARVSVLEFMLPLLLVILVLQSSGSENLRIFSNYLWTATILMLIVDTLWTRIRLRRALRERFPDESHRGATFYALVRMLQMRFMRLPKPKVKIGGQPR